MKILVLLEKIGNYGKETSSSLNEGMVYFGRIVHIGIDRNGLYYGHIGNGVDDDVFFHSTKNPNVDFKNMLFKNVSYKMEKDNRKGNLVAVNISIMPELKRKVIVVKKNCT
jgi:hypothetical protein